MRCNMKKAYLGIDIGSISTKAVVIDEKGKILASSYLNTEGNPISASKKVIRELKEKLDLNTYKVVGVGTTGSARKLIGTILGATTIKNEITAHATGTLSLYPDTKTIFEIGGQDSKIIIINNGVVTDYAMNTLCASGIGSFLSSEAQRLGIPIEDFGDIALQSKNPSPITSRCIVFAESDLIRKSQMGYKKEDIIMGLCISIANNYLNSVGKDKKIEGPIVLSGGVSQNKGIVKAFEDILGKSIITSPSSPFMASLGVALLATKNKEIDFSFDIEDITYETKDSYCHECSNNCEIIKIIKNNELIDSWGNRCPKGTLVHK